MFSLLSRFLSWRWFLLQLPLWSALILLVSAALLVLGLRALAPHVENWRPNLEAALSQRLPFAVTLNDLQLSLYRWDPQIELKNLRLQVDEQPFLTLDQARVEIDTWRSLLSASLRTRDLQLQSLQLWLEQTPQGWRPMDWVSDPDADPLDWVGWIEQLLVQGELDFDQISVHLLPLDGQPITLEADHLQYRRWSQGRQLVFSQPIDTGDAVELVVTLTDRALAQAQPRVDAWLSVPRLPRDALKTLWPDAWVEKTGLPEGDLSLEAWISWQAEALHLQAQIQRLDFSIQQGEVSAHNLQADVMFADAQWQLAWQAEQLMLQTQRFDQVAGHYRHQDGEHQLGFSGWSVASLVELAQRFPLPDALLPILQTLKPQGQLTSAQMRWQGAFEDWFLTAQVDDAQVQPWQGAPGVENLSAWVGVWPEGGEVVFTEQPLVLFFPELYSAPFDFEMAQGRVDWQLSDAGVSVTGTDLSVALHDPRVTQATRVTGEFDLFLGRGDRRFYLNLGLLPTAVSLHRQLVPQQVAPENLLTWLDLALDEGQVQQGGFIYAGSVMRGRPSTYQVLLDFEQTPLVFEPDWPPLTQAKGWVRVDERSVAGEVESAQLLDARLSQAHFFSQISEMAPQLLIDAELDSEAQLFPQLLNRSPLGQWVPEALHEWQYAGQVTGSIQLAIPLAERAPELDVGLQLQLDAAQLTLSQANLELTELSGPLSFSLNQGLGSDGLTGRWLDQAIEAQIDESTQRLSFTTRQPSESLLQWLDWSPWPWLQGMTEVQGDVWLQPDALSLDLAVDLTQVALDLPPPLTKPAGEPQRLNLHLDMSDERWPLQAGIEGHLSAISHLADADSGTQVWLFDTHLPEAPEPPGQPGLLMSLMFSELQADPLIRWLQTYYGPTSLSVLTGQEETATLPRIELQTPQLWLQAQSWGSLDLRIQPHPRGLEALWVNSIASGQLQTFPGGIDVQLSHLSLPKTQVDAEVGLRLPLFPVADPWQQADWRHLPDMSFKVDALSYGDQALGQWQARLITDEQGVGLTDVHGKMGETEVQAEAFWQQGDAPLTQINARLQGRDLAPALRAVLAAPAPLVSSQHQIETQLEWPASPLGFALIDLQGWMRLQLNDGHFPQLDGPTRGVSRLLGLMNMDRLVRRLRLDFSDITADGLSFDQLQANYVFEAGYLRTREPTRMLSASSRLTLVGDLNWIDETLDQRLTVELPVGQTLPLAAVLAGAPQVGALLWVTQKVFANWINTYTQATYRVQGPISQPEIELERLF